MNLKTLQDIEKIIEEAQRLRLLHLRCIRDGPRQFTQDVSCPALLRCSVVYCSICRIRSFHALRPYFPVGSPISIIKLLSKSYYPNFAETKPVWANPRSLATTEGITFVFFSYG